MFLQRSKSAILEAAQLLNAWFSHRNARYFSDAGPLEFAYKIAVRQKSRRLIHIELSQISGVQKITIFARFAGCSLFFRSPAIGYKQRLNGKAIYLRIEDSPRLRRVLQESVLLIQATRNTPLENQNFVARLSQELEGVHGVIFAVRPAGAEAASVSADHLERIFQTSLLRDATLDQALDRLHLKPALKGLSANPMSPGNRNIQIRYVPGGSVARAIKTGKTPSTVAVIPCYNEEDIIGETIEYALDQGMSVHILDNWSNDGTSQIVRHFSSRFREVTFERFPKHPTTQYLWFQILRRIEEYGAASEKNWIVHLDVDERFDSPIQGLTIPEFLGVADEAGFNVVDATNINFRPTRESQGGTSLKFWEFELQHWAFHVERAYKNTAYAPDIATSGGHIVKRPGKAVFPLNLLLKHYPVRSPEQAAKKILIDRKPRFKYENVTRGFHTQYNDASEDSNWLWNAAELNVYEATTLEEWLPELSTRAGLRPVSQGADRAFEKKK